MDTSEHNCLLFDINLSLLQQAIQIIVICTFFQRSKKKGMGFFCFANVLDLFTVLFETVMCYVLQWLSSHCSIFMPPQSGRHLALHLLFGLLTWSAWHSGHCFWPDFFQKFRSINWRCLSSCLSVRPSVRLSVNISWLKFLLKQNLSNRSRYKLETWWVGGQ